MSETSKTRIVRLRSGALTEDGFIPEWELHPEKFRYYLVGNPSSRFAITKLKTWAWPWQRNPRGGRALGPIMVWWSR